MIEANFEINDRLKAKIAARYGRFELRAGVLEDKAHRSALPKSAGLTSVAGGPARKRSTRVNGTVAEVAEIVRKVHRVDFLGAPLKNSRSKEMKAFFAEFQKLLIGKTTSRGPTENALRAVFRNPILEGRYGRNSTWWAKVKGFNRKVIDTGQLFQSILARVKVKKNVQG